MKIATEKRALRLAPGVVMQMIAGQSSSLAKAVTEAVMNSVDAYASRVDITLRPDFVAIEDDGRGFISRDEIQAWFEVLGGSAGEKGHRLFGEFGLGRAQLWKYCPTVWHTGGFRMEVNVPKSGFNYVLDEVPKRTGTRIEGQLFDELAPLQLQDTVREIKALCALVTTPVYLNGELISTAPSTLTWTHESELAFGELRKAKRGEQLAVYNQGVFVCWVRPADHANLAGKICTKEGQALKLNIARNQIMQDCPVWAEIRKEWLTEQPKAATVSPVDEAKIGAGRLAKLARNVAYRKSLSPSEGIDLGNDLKGLLNTVIARDVLGNNHTLAQVLQCKLPQLFSRIPPAGTDVAKKLQSDGVAIVYTNDTVAALTLWSGYGPKVIFADVLASKVVKDFLAARKCKPDLRFNSIDEEFPATREVIKPIEAPPAALRAALTAFRQALGALTPELAPELQSAWAAFELRPARMLPLARAQEGAVLVSDKALLAAFNDVHAMPQLSAAVLLQWLGQQVQDDETVRQTLMKIRVSERFFQVPALALVLRAEVQDADVPPLGTRAQNYLRCFVAA